MAENKSIKNRIFKIIDYNETDTIFINKLFNYFMLTLIIINLFVIVIDTVKTLPTNTRSILSIVDYISTIIFTIEYLLRLYTADLLYPEMSKIKAIKKYVFSGMAIIDLLSVLPFYLPFIIPVNLSVLRGLRLFRIIRLMKLNRYTSAMKNVIDVINNKKYELVSSFIVIITLMLISSILMFNIESEAQPKVFTNAFDGLWWATATLTTVGYGDIYPITLAGKILSAIIALFGIGLVAIPTGIISSGFVEKVSNNEKYNEITDELVFLKRLQEDNIITIEDFNKEKSKILSNIRKS